MGVSSSHIASRSSDRILPTQFSPSALYRSAVRFARANHFALSPVSLSASGKVLTLARVSPFSLVHVSYKSPHGTIPLRPEQNAVLYRVPYRLSLRRTVPPCL
jgi:hypothetical protein